MTRKRFMKRLMQFGVTRNQAAEMARQRPAEMSYGKYYCVAAVIAELRNIGKAAAKTAADAWWFRTPYSSGGRSCVAFDGIALPCGCAHVSLALSERTKACETVG